jgi:chemotaxis methyl-accepting protein methylase
MGFYRKFVEIAIKRRWQQVWVTQSVTGREPLSLAMGTKLIREALLRLLI